MTAAPVLTPRGTQPITQLSTGHGTWYDCYTPLTYYYQWFWSTAAPPGGTRTAIPSQPNASYLPTSVYMGDYITVDVTACDTGDECTVVTAQNGSGGTGYAYIAPPPTLTTPPTISPSGTGQNPNGTAYNQATAASWSSGISITSYQYQWARNGTRFGTATSTPTAYTSVCSADAGTTLTLQVQAINADGSSNWAVSSNNAQFVPCNTSAPSISPGVAVAAARETLNATSGSWASVNAISGTSYRWLRDGSVISGATSSTYTTTNFDIAHCVASQVAVTNSYGTSAWATSSNSACAGYNASAFDVAWSAGAMPAIAQSLRLIPMATWNGHGTTTTPVDLGWKIIRQFSSGVTADTNWVKLSGSLGTPSTNATIISEYWCAYGEVCDQTGTNFGSGPVYGVLGQDLIFQEGMDSSCQDYGGGVNTGWHEGSVFFSGGSWDGSTPAGYSDCAAAMLAAAQAVGASDGLTLRTLGASDCASQEAFWWASHLSGATCEVLIMPGLAVESALVASPVVPFTNQHVDVTTTFTLGGLGSTAASERYGGPNAAIPGLCNCNGYGGDPVNAATGDYYDQTTDASAASYGPPLAFTRTYDASMAQAESTSGSPGPLGYGWTDNWNMSLAFNAPVSGAITVTQADGAQVSFYAPVSGACVSPYVGSGASGTYCALPHVTASLTYNSGSSTYSFVTHPYRSYTFDSAGNLTGESTAGGASVSVAHNTPSPGSGSCPSGATSCTTVTGASGRALVIASNSAGEVTSVTDPLGRTTTYTYCSPPSGTCSAGDLISVTRNPLGRKTSFTYDQANGNPALVHDLLTVTRPNGQPGAPDAGAKLVNSYDSAGRVRSQTATPTGTATRSSPTRTETPPSTSTRGRSSSARPRATAPRRRQRGRTWPIRERCLTTPSLIRTETRPPTSTTPTGTPPSSSTPSGTLERTATTISTSKPARRCRCRHRRARR
jgi:hypothetical protein